MNVTITPGLLRGEITPPPSKSQAHRVLIAAALAEGESAISNLADSQDILATRRCLAVLKESGEELPLLDCGESGSTLRFLIPIALVLRGGARFTGHGRLMERPQQPYFDLFDEKGIDYRLEDGVLTVKGRLTPGIYSLPGDVSSQFITGLLFALPLLDGDSEIRLTTRLESRHYVDLTREAMSRFGVEVKGSWQNFFVPGRQTYRAQNTAVEADWSQAGFWYAARGIGNDVSITGMNMRSIQGDRMIAEWEDLLLDRPWKGVTVPIYGEAGSVPAVPPAKLPGRRAVGLDVSHCPDLVPPLAAWGALLGDTDLYLKNAARLRLKESDRLATVTQVLTAMGAKVVEEPDRLIIFGQESLAGGVTVSSHNDHRIAMMAAIAATRCANPVTITGAECVAKSYPNFWEDYVKLGGTIQCDM